MEIGESFFWKNHVKLAQLRILAPKIFHDQNDLTQERYVPLLLLVFFHWLEYIVFQGG